MYLEESKKKINKVSYDLLIYVHILYYIVITLKINARSSLVIHFKDDIDVSYFKFIDK